MHTIIRYATTLLAIMLLPCLVSAAQSSNTRSLLRPGASYDVTKAGLTGTITELNPQKPQHYAQGLLHSGLLYMLNRAKAQHTLIAQGDKADTVRFLMVTEGKSSYVLGFSGNTLEAVLLKASVTVDTAAGGGENRHTAARLQPIHAFLSEIGTECQLKPLDTDEHNNHFLYTGTCSGQAQTYLEYHPEKDEFWVLFYK